MTRDAWIANLLYAKMKQFGKSLNENVYYPVYPIIIATG